MTRQVLVVSTFLLFLNFSLVICREDYYQYFTNHFSHHHRKSTPDDSLSTTEAAISLTAGVSSSGQPSNIAVKSSGEHHEHHHGFEYDTTNYDVAEDYARFVLILSVVSVVVCLLFFVIGVCIFVCCRNSGRTVRQGFVLSSASGNLTGGQPQQAAYAKCEPIVLNPQGLELPPPYSTLDTH